MSWIDDLQTTDDGVNILPHDANDYPTLQELVQHYTGKPQTMVTQMFTPRPDKKSGGFNDTYFYKTNNNERLAFRVSKEPVYTYSERWKLDILFDRFFNTKVPEKTDLKLSQKDMDKIKEQTEKNWLIANKKEICPRIIYYGYIKYTKTNLSNSENDVQVKSCLITEAYNYDLYSFYKSMSERHAGEIIQLNKYVCEYLVELIDKYVESDIVCSVVIKIVNNTIDSSEDIQVRLIDLDGDFCKTIENSHTKNKIVNEKNILARTPINEVKKYLYDRSFIKIGCNAPEQVLREMYESVILSGNVTNTNSTIIMENYLNTS